jgi:NAD(P) transhydrogenase subunit beta
VNPEAGMPIIEVGNSGSVIVLKRSMNTGFAGIDNPLFYADNTSLLFGDAKESVQKVLKAVEDL